MSENTIPTYADFVARLFNKSPSDPSKNFTHCILGIVTEIHEYLCATDEINGLEELGDLAFYCEALRQHVVEVTGEDYKRADSTLKLVDRSDVEGPASIIVDLCNTLLDDAKRWVGYGKAPRNLHETLNTCLDLVKMVNITGPYPCFNDDRIKAVNMAKLLKRYPDGEFDAYRAIVRDLEAERVVLQTA